MNIPPPVPPKLPPTPARVSATSNGSTSPPVLLMKRVGVELSAIASTTTEHTVNIAKLALAYVRLRSANQAEWNARVALGEILFKAQNGDRSLINRIIELDEQIRNIEAAKASPKHLRTERIGALVRLATTTLAINPATINYEPAIAQCRSAAAAVAHQQSELTTLKSSLCPAGPDAWRRLSVGYGTMALCIMLALMMGSRSAHLLSASKSNAPDRMTSEHNGVEQPSATAPESSTEQPSAPTPSQGDEIKRKAAAAYYAKINYGTRPLIFGDSIFYSENGQFISGYHTSLSSGAAAYISSFVVVQIIDSRTMLVEVGDAGIALAIGWKTDGLVDGARLYPGIAALVTGIAEYETVLGANKRVYKLVPFDDLDSYAPSHAPRPEARDRTRNQ